MALDCMGGFTLFLAALKAWMEHGIALDAVADRDPEAHVLPWPCRSAADDALPLIPVRRSPRGRALHPGWMRVGRCPSDRTRWDGAQRRWGIPVGAVGGGGAWLEEVDQAGASSDAGSLHCRGRWSDHDSARAGEPVEWACRMPLLPHALLMATGLCVFDLPGVAGRRCSAEGSGDG